MVFPFCCQRGLAARFSLVLPFPAGEFLFRPARLLNQRIAFAVPGGPLSRLPFYFDARFFSVLSALDGKVFPPPCLMYSPLSAPLFIVFDARVSQ